MSGLQGAAALQDTSPAPKPTGVMGVAQYPWLNEIKRIQRDEINLGRQVKLVLDALISRRDRLCRTTGCLRVD